MTMFSEDLKKTRQEIEAYANEHSHELIVTEHLLLGLLDNECAKELLDDWIDDKEQLKKKLIAYLDEFVPKGTGRAEYSRAFERVLERAVILSKSLGAGSTIDSIDVLAALMSEEDSYAVKLLLKHDASELGMLYRLQDKTSKPKKSNGIKPSTEKSKSSEKKRKGKHEALDIFTYNLNERARDGKTDPLIGRSKEIERVAQILCRRRKNNPLLVGDSGVGKTAIAEGLAWLIEKGEVNHALQGKVIYSLDMGALMAGTEYRGEFESRIQDLLYCLRKKPNAILFIDEIHTVIGAGSTSSNAMDMSNLLKPALANGELRCMGSTTFSEFRERFEKDHALARRFQKVDIKAPSIEDSIEILKGLQHHYEAHHNVKYSDEAIRAAVTLAVKHLHERQLPDKAIDVLDEAGAKIGTGSKKLTHQSLSNDDELLKFLGTKPNKRNVHKTKINVSDIENVIANMAGIPTQSISGNELELLKGLKDSLQQAVFGQDEAIDKLCDVITLSRAGLKAPNKPVGSFLFAGPTGVGKTEIANQLAYALSIPLLRFDMSEYMEAHSVARLIGAPPGYVGHDKGGLLTEKVQQNPYCVLLLDELEKAHSDVFNLLLQVMDYGKLTDSNGREVSFREVVLIMTSNVGAENLSRASMGFTKQNHQSDNSEAIKRAFSPEFRNRLDSVVQFLPLNQTVIGRIVDKLLQQLQTMLDEKRVQMTVSPAAKAYLANQGYDDVMGARPMARLVDDEIKKPLAQELLFGELAKGGRVKIDSDGKALQFASTAASPVAKDNIANQADNDEQTKDKTKQQNNMNH